MKNLVKMWRVPSGVKGRGGRRVEAQVEDMEGEKERRVEREVRWRVKVSFVRGEEVGG